MAKSMMSKIKRGNAGARMANSTATPASCRRARGTRERSGLTSIAYLLRKSQVSALIHPWQRCDSFLDLPIYMEAGGETIRVALILGWGIAEIRRGKTRRSGFTRGLRFRRAGEGQASAPGQ